MSGRKPLEKKPRKPNTHKKVVEKAKTEFFKEPNRVFAPKSLVKTPLDVTSCPYDNAPLVKIRAYIPDKLNSIVPCCFYCGCAFLPPNTPAIMDNLRIPSRSPGQKSRKAKKIGVHKPYKKRAGQTVHFSSCADEWPSSTIVVVKLNPGGFITVVSDPTQQDSKNGVYWIGRLFPAVLMTAMAKKRRAKFTYNDRTYKVTEASYKRDPQKYFDILTRFSKPGGPSYIPVIDESRAREYEKFCQYVFAMIPYLNVFDPVPTPVLYNERSGAYYISEAVYAEYAKRYGLPYVLRDLLPTYHDDEVSPFGSFRKHSLLNILGYSVGQSAGLTVDARRRILMGLVDAEIMPGYEIRKHLQMLSDINKHSSSMINAVMEWQSDIAFLVQYEASEHESIWVNTFRLQSGQMVSVPKKLCSRRIDS